MGVMKRIHEAVGARNLRDRPRMVEYAIWQVCIENKEGMPLRCGLPQYTPKQRRRIDAMARAIRANL